MSEDPGSVRSGEPGEMTAELGAVLLTEQTLDELLDLVVSLARRTIDGADGVSVSLTQDGRLRTSNYSDDLVRELDEVQYREREGPCVHCIATGEVVSTTLVDDARFPKFSEAALQRFITTVMATPLRTSAATIGSINFYSGTVESYTFEQLELASLFTRQASILLANAVAFASSTTMNRNLEEALVTREVIGEAKGIIMAQQRCSPEEAFDRLRTESQHSNRKLRAIAEEYVNGVQLQPER